VRDVVWYIIETMFSISSIKEKTFTAWSHIRRIDRA